MCLAICCFLVLSTKQKDAIVAVTTQHSVSSQRRHNYACNTVSTARSTAPLSVSAKCLISRPSTQQHWFHSYPDPAGSNAESAAASEPHTLNLSEARKAVAPLLSATANLAAASTAKPGKGASKAEGAPGPVPAPALSQLKAAAEACEAVMLKLNTASNAAGELACKYRQLPSKACCLWRL